MAKQMFIKMPRSAPLNGSRAEPRIVAMAAMSIMLCNLHIGTAGVNQQNTLRFRLRKRRPAPRRGKISTIIIIWVVTCSKIYRSGVFFTESLGKLPAQLYK